MSYRGLVAKEFLFLYDLIHFFVNIETNPWLGSHRFFPKFLLLHHHSVLSHWQTIAQICWQHAGGEATGLEKQAKLSMSFLNIKRLRM